MDAIIFLFGFTTKAAYKRDAKRDSGLEWFSEGPPRESQHDFEVISSPQDAVNKASRVHEILILKRSFPAERRRERISLNFGTLGEAFRPALESKKRSGMK